MAKNKLSIIIPCYLGMESIYGVLESISKQKEVDRVEIVLIIDGPNKQIRKIIDSFLVDNPKAFPSYKLEQSKHNEGRFAARYKGAQLATSEKLLFIDDRTEMKDDYLENIINLAGEKQVVVSNVIEKNQPNFISKTISILRSKLYKSWGSDFEPYYINKNNFDESPKGTAGLLVDRKIFFESAKKFMSISKADRESSDDTKLLRLIMEYSDIYRSSKPQLLYLPRDDWRVELVHMYKRGPKFIDYYFFPKSPYYLYLVILYVITVLSIVMVVIYPIFLIYEVTSLLLLVCIIGWLLGKKMVDKLSLILGLVCISSAFIFGIYVGLIKKLFR